MESETGFARLGAARIAYQVDGDAPLDLVSTPGSFVAFDVTKDDPLGALYYQRLASFARVIRFDRRGTGSSDPIPDNTTPTVESHVEEALAVMDLVGSRNPAFLAAYDAGAMAITLAATRPERVSALILVNTTASFIEAQDYPLGFDRDAAEALVATFEETWGTPETIGMLVPSRSDDQDFLSRFARLQRLTISPAQAADFFRAMFDVDVRDLLPQVKAPTLVLHRDRFGLIPKSHGEYIAERIPDARFQIVPGSDGPIIWEHADLVLDAIEEFLTDVQPSSRPDRVITTLVFTDIVDSTRRVEQLGDRRWGAFLDVHQGLAENIVAINRGTLVKSTGDGFLATFDNPGSAVAAAQRLAHDMRAVGLETRTGIHTAEVERRGDDVAGLGVHVASRIMDAAGAGEILVSGTVKDLAFGSDFRFRDRGHHSLKGLDGEWHLFAVERR